MFRLNPPQIVTNVAFGRSITLAIPLQISAERERITGKGKNTLTNTNDHRRTQTIRINRVRVISLCRLSARQSGPYLQDLRKRVHVLQFVDETREGGVRTSAEVPVPLLPKADQVTLQPAEAHAKKARLRAPEVSGIGDGGTATASKTKAKF